MGNMIPSEQYLQDYTFATPGGGQFVENYVSVVADNSDLATFLINGAPLPLEAFSPISGTTFSSAEVLLTEGTHTTATVNKRHGITVQGYNNYDSYIYPGGALFQFINPVGDTNPPICTAETIPGPPPFSQGLAEDNRPSEDANGNGMLDPGEDLNRNGLVDEDAGIFLVELRPGSTNVSLDVSSFIPRDGAVSYTVNLIDPDNSGTGVVVVTDGAGNSCEQTVDLAVTPLACDADEDGNIDNEDIALIFAARNTPTSGPSDQRDVDGDGTITVLDSRQCVLRCNLPMCAEL